MTFIKSQKFYSRKDFFTQNAKFFNRKYFHLYGTTVLLTQILHVHAVENCTRAEDISSV